MAALLAGIGTAASAIGSSGIAGTLGSVLGNMVMGDVGKDLGPLGPALGIGGNAILGNVLGSGNDQKQDQTQKQPEQTAISPYASNAVQSSGPFQLQMFKASDPYVQQLLGGR